MRAAWLGSSGLLCLDSAECRVEAAERLVGLGFSDDERRKQADDGFRCPIDDDAAFEGRGNDRRRVARQLKAPHQASASNFLDDGVRGRKRAKPLLEMTADAADMGQQPAANEFVKEAQRGTASEQVAAVGAAVI